VPTGRGLVKPCVGRCTQAAAVRVRKKETGEGTWINPALEARLSKKHKKEKKGKKHKKKHKHKHKKDRAHRKGHQSSSSSDSGADGASASATAAPAARQDCACGTLSWSPTRAVPGLLLGEGQWRWRWG
jgi:hypothetical protein